MPGRLTPLITGQIYHLFNRGIDRRPTFTNKREYRRAQETINYYRVFSPPICLAKFLKLEEKRKKEISQILQKGEKLVKIFCYCLMPNHFHFLLEQTKENGIAKFLSNFQNSYTRYFNVRHDRDGALFLDQFKAVRVETDEQLVHLSRYIHLNPYTSYVVKSLAELKAYPWSSFPVYLGQEGGELIEKETILGFFKNIKDYQKFVFDQGDYQRKLKEIEHLLLEAKIP